MKKTRKALRLDKETIRELGPAELPHAAGGSFVTAYCTWTCGTQHCTHTLGCPQ